MDNLYYLVPIILLLSAAYYVYRQIDREMMYFRFSCENIFDIDYYEYVNNYKFFNFFNEQLSEHLRLYVQDRFHALRIPYKDLQLSAQVEFDKITITCYLEANRNKHDYIQEEIIRTVNLEDEIKKFHAFYEKARDPEFQHVFRLKECYKTAPNKAL
ncbi:hypothetical protein [Actinobacillus vicugnae]|uniref:hypothetical protein n=1 Tax=Actinobacillus vicugnae TaxID=2573093 RepID=UPI001FCB7348|nr:hypothetical protein [Actinobacillus vicugnae]